MNLLLPLNSPRRGREDNNNPHPRRSLVAVEDPALSAAIVDHALGDGDSSELCARLKERNVPFVTYSGYANLTGACAEAVHVNKPATPSVLVTTVKGLLPAGPPISN